MQNPKRRTQSGRTLEDDRRGQKRVSAGAVAVARRNLEDDRLPRRQLVPPVTFTSPSFERLSKQGAVYPSNVTFSNSIRRKLYALANGRPSAPDAGVTLQFFIVNTIGSSEPPWMSATPPAPRISQFSNVMEASGRLQHHMLRPVKLWPKSR